MEKYIEVNDLCFEYENSKVLSGAKLSVEKGDFLGLLGENGSGKSTLIKLIAGMEKPKNGSIKIFGKEIDSFTDWSKIGYVPQKVSAFNQSFPATVEEIVASNIYSGFGLFWRGAKERSAKVKRALELVGMEDFAKRQIGKLSGGQQQRVFIARAIASNPDILLMDEPTVGIDSRNEEAVYCLLSKLNHKYGITVVMVTHDISAISTHASKIALLEDGKVKTYSANNKELSDNISKLFGTNVQINFSNSKCDSCEDCGGESNNA